MTLNKRIQHRYDRGYTEQTIFPDEYILLVNPKTLSRVRLYPGHTRHRELCTDYVATNVEKDPT